MTRTALYLATLAASLINAAICAAEEDVTYRAAVFEVAKGYRAELDRSLRSDKPVYRARLRQAKRVIQAWFENGARPDEANVIEHWFVQATDRVRNRGGEMPLPPLAAFGSSSLSIAESMRTAKPVPVPLSPTNNTAIENATIEPPLHSLVESTNLGPSTDPVVETKETREVSAPPIDLPLLRRRIRSFNSEIQFFELSLRDQAEWTWDELAVKVEHIEASMRERDVSELYLRLMPAQRRQELGVQGSLLDTRRLLEQRIANSRTAALREQDRIAVSRLTALMQRIRQWKIVP